VLTFSLYITFKYLASTSFSLVKHSSLLSTG
jgi:hypothetical protein